MNIWIIILLKSWMYTPLQTHVEFSIEMQWTIFRPTQNFPIDSMLTDETQ